jgi:hypothetical protein
VASIGKNWWTGTANGRSEETPAELTANLWQLPSFGVEFRSQNFHLCLGRFDARFFPTSSWCPVLDLIMPTSTMSLKNMFTPASIVAVRKLLLPFLLFGWEQGFPAFLCQNEGRKNLH